LRVRERAERRVSARRVFGALQGGNRPLAAAREVAVVLDHPPYGVVGEGLRSLIVSKLSRDGVEVVLRWP